MLASGVTDYAAINARVRVMYATLYTPQDLAVLGEAVDFPTLVGQLKHSPYGPYLERVSDKDLTPRRTVFQIKARVADQFASIIRMSPKQARQVLIQLFRYFEVDNLKAVLRGIVTGASWDRVRFVLFPPSTITNIPAQAMVEAGSIGAAVELLRGTPYYETLSHAMKRYSAEQNLFPLEVALDLDYWRSLWKETNNLPAEDRTQGLRVVGTLIDITNLMWAIRYREYHHISEEELINYTLSFGYRVSDKDIRDIAAGADIAQVVKRVYPHLSDVDMLIQENHKNLPKLETELKRHLMNQCKAVFVGSPFHIGLSLAYLMLTELEIQDLTVLIEAKSSHTPDDEFRQYLL
ncbi:MAG TPA: V-type ATPase subunit [Anaerolineaceae bacterium]